MSAIRTVQPLPRHTRRKWLKAEGRWAYYFAPPTKFKNAGCAIKAEALGFDYAAAVDRVENVLLPQLDSWRTDGLSDLAPAGPGIGTFRWMVDLYRSHRTWHNLGQGQRKLHDNGFALVGSYTLRDGRSIDQVFLASLTPEVVDAVYDKLLLVEEEDEAGEKTTRVRLTTVNHAMKSCRRAWNVVFRQKPLIVPQANPFSRMGLKESSRKTPLASLEELLAFVAKADELGRASLGTAAWIGWEWLQREEDIFGTFAVEHYRPKERPHAVRVVHDKTGEESWIPLVGSGRVALYPELAARLDAVRKGRIAGLMITRDWLEKGAAAPKPWITENGDLTQMRHEVKDIIRKAGLRDELSFTSFRHGGFTETSDAGATEEEIRATGRHKSAKVLPRYSVITMSKVESAASKRQKLRKQRAHDRLSELD